MSISQRFPHFPMTQAGNERVTSFSQPLSGKQPLPWQPLFFSSNLVTRNKGEKEKSELRPVVKAKKKKDSGYVAGKKKEK